MPQISVVMPVYNTPIPILKEAVDSILDQTFRDFEFIIIDDNSSDESRDYVSGLTDKRVRVIRNSDNLGVTKSLNIGFAAATGKYIARMDSDDISLPRRFEKQYAYMQRHPDVIVCGTNVERFGAYSAVSLNRIRDMETYRIAAVFKNPGPVHPTAFFNRDLLKLYYLTYDERLTYAQDYGLWVEIARHGKVHILPNVLLRYRMHNLQISTGKRNIQILCDIMTQEKMLRELLGQVTSDELMSHYLWSTGYYNERPSEETVNWYSRLISANDAKGIYDRHKFREYVFCHVQKDLVRSTLPKEASVIKIIDAYMKHIPFPYSIKTITEIPLIRLRHALHR